MSTKTTFKRIALVAVAALGLGVLSVAPSSAAPSSLVVTTAAGSAAKTTGGDAESATATTIAVSGYAASVGDSVTVSVIQDTWPTTATAGGFRLGLSDTGTSTVSVVANGAALATPLAASAGAKKAAAYDSVTVSSTGSGFYGVSTGTNAGAFSANFILAVDSNTMTTRYDGTYGFTVVVKSYELGALKATATYPTTFVISKAASQSTTVDPTQSTAIMSLGSTWKATSTDSAVALVSTAATADQAVIRVITNNAAGTGTAESITATITGAGVIGFGGVYGKNITVAGGGQTDLLVRADGTAGTGSIVIKTTTVTFAAKTVTFFAKSAATITASVNKPVIGTAGDTDVIRAVATDASGNVWGGQAYIYAASAADALIAGSETPAKCTFNSAKGYHECPVAGTAKGTANFKVIDAATVALMTATSASAAVRVSLATPASVKISFDKASYAPGEKALVLVTVLDADGNALPAQTVSNVFAAAPVVSTAFSGTAPTFTTSAALEAATSASAGTVAGSQAFVAYMPYFAGTITITATGSTGLATAGRVAVTASATVVNASVDAATDAANEATDAANAATDAALAAADAADAATAAAQDASDAVAALSATVATLVASLKAQITSLTNLVIKIQKKVKA
jgi:hypothetical protein